MLIRRLHRHTMPPSASPTSRDAGDLNRRKRRAISAEIGSACKITTRTRKPAAGAGEAVAFEQARLRDPAAGVEQLDKGVKSRLVDAPPDGLDICLHTTHHNAVIPPLRSGVGPIGEAVQGRGFSGRQVKGPEHARDIGRGHGMFRILFHIVNSEQTRELRPKLVLRRPEHDWGPVVLY